MSTEGRLRQEAAPASRPGGRSYTGDSSATEEIAVVGRAEAVVAFRAAGLAVFPVEPGPLAGDKVRSLAAAGYRVIFFTEDLFPVLGPVLEAFRKSAVPCLVALPLGGERVSAARLKELVKRAVGADVFGRTPGAGNGNEESD